MPDKILKLLENFLLENIFTSVSVDLGRFNGFWEAVDSFFWAFTKENKKVNLSAIRDKQGFLIKHVVDSLTILPLVHTKTIVDWGSGGGFPGLPLLIAKEKLKVGPKKVFFIESVGKKAKAIEELARFCDLQSCEIVHSRGESWGMEHNSIDLIVFRAVGSPEKILHWTKHLNVPLLIMTGEKGAFEWERVLKNRSKVQRKMNIVLDVSLPLQFGSRKVLLVTY